MSDIDFVNPLHVLNNRMLRYGGSFESHIARAMEVADMSNRQLLLNTFGHMWKKYDSNVWED